LRQSFETAKARLESGLKDLLPGSNAHVKVVTEIAGLERDYREERASRGLDPERLGSAGVTAYRFIAHIGTGGSVSTVQVEAEKLEQVLATERKKNAELMAKVNTPERAAEEAKLNAEFGFDQQGIVHSYDHVTDPGDPNE
jgi:hypothetical protein